MIKVHFYAPGAIEVGALELPSVPRVGDYFRCNPVAGPDESSAPVHDHFKVAEVIYDLVDGTVDCLGVDTDEFR
jgi:hypothetical protein